MDQEKLMIAFQELPETARHVSRAAKSPVKRQVALIKAGLVRCGATSKTTFLLEEWIPYIRKLNRYMEQVWS